MLAGWLLQPFATSNIYIYTHTHFEHVAPRVLIIEVYIDVENVSKRQNYHLKRGERFFKKIHKLTEFNVQFWDL